MWQHVWCTRCPKRRYTNYKEKKCCNGVASRQKGQSTFALMQRWIGPFVSTHAVVEANLEILCVFTTKQITKECEEWWWITICNAIRIPRGICKWIINLWTTKYMTSHGAVYDTYKTITLCNKCLDDDNIMKAIGIPLLWKHEQRMMSSTYPNCKPICSQWASFFQVV